MKGEDNTIGWLYGYGGNRVSGDGTNLIFTNISSNE